MSQQPPTLEEAVEHFLAERRSGADIRASEFASRHPHLSPDLLDALEAIETLEGAHDEEQLTALPTRIGTFRVERELGRGGMGVVVEAVEEPLGRRVALKLLPPELLSSPAARIRFRREAVLASRLEHSGVCPIYGAGVADGQPWIAMRLVEGTTLAHLIRTARASGARSVDLPGAAGAEAHRAVATCIARVARALEYAHAQGVLHRDVKPSNLVVTASGEPVLLDFGLAIEPDSDAPTLTRTGETAGTPIYLAPELLSGERVRSDERCDVYALGVTLYECLALEAPFRGATRDALFRSKVGAASDVRRAAPAVPRDLAVIVATAMEADPARRYASAGLLATDLEAFVEGRPIAARPVGTWGRIARWAKREPKQAVFAGAATVAALALTLVAGILIASRGDVQAGREARLVKTIEAELFQAFVDLGQRRPAEADERFARVLALEPANADAKVGRVLSQLRLRRSDRALELLRDTPATPCYERLRAMASDRPPPPEDLDWIVHASAFELFVDGEALRLEGDRKPPSERKEWMRKALARFEEAVVRAPQARRLYHLIRAWTAAEAHDEQAARSASAALLALWPHSAFDVYQAGAALVEVDPVRSRAILEHAAELDPRHAPTFQCLATTYMVQGEFDRALAPLQRAIEIDPEDVEAHNSLGSAWSNLGCRDEARSAFLAALSIDPGAIEPWANLVVVAADERDMQQALEHVLELDPGLDLYRAGYGEVLERTGDLQGALEQFARLVAEVPGSAMYWAAYARLLTHSGELHTARDAARIARSIDADAQNLAEVEAYLQDALGSEQ